MEIKKRFNRLVPLEPLWIFLIVAATLIMHLSTINEPAELILDEQHYIAAARSIITEGKDTRMEHPTLGKLLLAGSILLFGDNPTGWRALPVLFGTIDIILFFSICRRLHLSPRARLIAVYLFAFENMNFIQASVAMLDVFFFTFMLASFWLYLRKKYSLSAVSLGLSALCKLTGAMAAGAIGMHWFITQRESVRGGLSALTNRLSNTAIARRLRPEGKCAPGAARRTWWPVIEFTASFLLAPLSFLVLMPIFDYIASGELTNPLWRVKEMMTLMTSLTFTNARHDSMSRPWEWLYYPRAMPYWYNPSYLGIMSYTIWALTIPAAVYLVYRMWRGSSAATFAFWWFAFTFIPWIPASILTDRISFIFYFYPAIGAVCIGIGLAFSRLLGKARGFKRPMSMIVPGTVIIFMLAHFVILAVISPVFT